MIAHQYLREHLNVNWLRPESALFDAIASTVVSQFPLDPPSLDLGAGNGIFSFITAGGGFSLEYDWYRNANPAGFWSRADIYDVYVSTPTEECVGRAPMYRINAALDAKPNLLRQARGLGFYRSLLAADANHLLPFQHEAFQTVFSNMLYWLDSAESALREVHRVLRKGGHALLCMPNDNFERYCVSYRWRELNSELLRLLNRGRAESKRWSVSYSELSELVRDVGFAMEHYTTYLSHTTLRAWDVGMRPLSPVLIHMTQMLNEADRLTIKTEMMEIVQPFLRELLTVDGESNEEGGFRFVYLRKT